MTKDNLKIGEISKPRFEFRTFGQDFEAAGKRMSRLSVPIPEKVWERYSEETYIVSRTNDINNTKIRDGKMDIKTFVQEKNGLEQWNPLMKAEFPVSKDLIANDIFTAFQVVIPELDKETYTLEEFLSLINTHPDLQAVSVVKKRYGYMVNNTICEMAEVLINGAKLSTLSSESTEIDDIQKTLKDLNIENIENINYLQAIKRVIGMTNKKFVN